MTLPLQSEGKARVHIRRSTKRTAAEINVDVENSFKLRQQTITRIRHMILLNWQVLAMEAMHQPHVTNAMDIVALIQRKFYCHGLRRTRQMRMERRK